MKERPILFSGPMVRAILEGRKTQTRRVKGLDRVNMNPDARTGARPNQDGTWHFFMWDGGNQYGIPACPYGQPGDRLWVRENFQICSNFHVDCRGSKPPFNDGRPIHRNNDPDWPVWQQCYYAASDPCPELISPETDEIEQRWRPSIHMPRWACRIVLEIVSVRVERLQSISEDDAVAEGMEPVRTARALAGESRPPPASTQFADLWDSINGPESWQANPWVWVIEFKRV